MSRNNIKTILSIDFDYFQDVTPELLREYPDGIDVSTELSTVIWSSKYCFNGKRLKEIKPLSEELRLLKKLIKAQDPHTKILISQSHKDIYKWIHDNVAVGEKMCLINIDMHHDMFNENKQLDCGNWVKFIMNEYGRENMGFKWIANPVSFEMYGFEKNEEESKLFHSYIGTSINDIGIEKFDMIFLCRSDAWLPPHLDDDFNDVVKLMIATSCEGKICSNVAKPRDYQRYIVQMENSMTHLSEL